MAATITQTTSENGSQIYSVDPNGEQDITLATAGTYVDKNIQILINPSSGIEEDVLSKITVTYNTVADMIDDAENIEVGQLVQTRGYYAIGDGGDACYAIKSGTASDALKLQINDDIYGEAYLEELNTYNVLKYGIKRDGVTDVTETIQNIIYNIPHDSTLFFPAGEYLFSDSISPRRVITYKGSNSSIYKNSQYDSGGTKFILNSDGFSGKYFIDFQASANAKRGNIEDIYFKCDSYDVEFDVSKLISANKTDSFKETVTVDDVNCLRLGYNNTIKNCTFIGWSGYAISGILREVSWTAWSSVDRCYFYHCKYGIETCVDSQFMNLRFDECYIGIICDGSANTFTNIRMDSMGKHAIKMTGNRCTSNTIIGMDVDVCFGAGLVVHGDRNYIQGRIGRCGALSSGKTQDEIAYGELDNSCSIYLDDYDCGTTTYNKIDVVLAYGIIYEYTTEENYNSVSAPAVLVGASGGNYAYTSLEIMSNKTIDNSDVLFKNILLCESATLNAPADTPQSYFQGKMIINKEDYVIEEYGPYPFDRNIVTCNNFLMGFARNPDERPPYRIGTMMEHYWQDRYCLSVYNSSTYNYEWIDIKNPAISKGMFGEKATASAQETGIELSKLRRRLANLEAALNTSNITNVSYPDIWKSQSETDRQTPYTKVFEDLDLSENEVEFVINLTNAESVPNGMFFNFVNGYEDEDWNNTGWHIEYAGLNAIQPFISNLNDGVSALYATNYSLDFSKKITVRINRYGMTINDEPVKMISDVRQTTYDTTLKNLINYLLTLKKYSMSIVLPKEGYIESIRIINYNVSDTNVVKNFDAAIEDIPNSTSKCLVLNDYHDNDTEESTKTWTLKGTMTSTDEMSINLTGCTEMIIRGYVVGTSNVNLKCTQGTLIASIGINGNRGSYARFKDNFLGLEGCVGRYTTNNTYNSFTGGNLVIGCFTKGTKISDITKLSFNDATLVTSCDIKIYAR